MEISLKYCYEPFSTGQLATKTVYSYGFLTVTFKHTFNKIHLYSVFKNAVRQETKLTLFALPIQSVCDRRVSSVASIYHFEFCYMIQICKKVPFRISRSNNNSEMIYGVWRMTEEKG